MDFAALPPEINSARMYTGPGSAPMLAAAVSWDDVSAGLQSAASAYGSVISGLAGSAWLGPASESMVAAVIPYLAGMARAAGQAEHAANQARAAASAYETAFAATVPPPVIAANRSLLASLVATNVLGQNTPAIAATEAHYAEMWAQDATAMYGYAAASASAVELTPFAPPAPTTNGEGVAAQASAVAEAAPGLLSLVPQALQGLAAGPSPTSLSSLSTLLGVFAPYAGVLAGGIGLVGAGVGTGAGSVGLVDIVLGIVGTTAQAGAMASGTVASATVSPATAGAGSSVLVSTSAAAPAALAEMGGAGRIGALSVPQGWPAGAPSATPPVPMPAIQLTAEVIPTAMPQAMWSALPIGQLTGRPRGSAGVRYQAAPQRSATESRKCG